MLHTYTVLYIQEISKYFTNYSSYPRGSHFLGKEVTSDKNLVPNGLPFQSQVKWSRVGGGKSCTRSPQLLLALRAAAASIPPLSPSHMFMQLGEQGEIMSGHAEQQGQQETRATYRNIMALSRFLKTHGHFSKLEARKE